MKKKLLRRITKASKVPLVGVPTIGKELHQRFTLGDDPDGGEHHAGEIAAAATEIRRRQLAKLAQNPELELPAEMERYA